MKLSQQWKQRKSTVPRSSSSHGVKEGVKQSDTATANTPKQSSRPSRGNDVTRTNCELRGEALPRETNARQSASDFSFGSSFSNDLDEDFFNAVDKLEQDFLDKQPTEVVQHEASVSRSTAVTGRSNASFRTPTGVPSSVKLHNTRKRCHGTATARGEQRSQLSSSPKITDYLAKAARRAAVDDDAATRECVEKKRVTPATSRRVASSDASKPTAVADAEAAVAAGDADDRTGRCALSSRRAAFLREDDATPTADADAGVVVAAGDKDTDARRTRFSTARD
ncbi:PREDICTED: uncharacterized protein LOC106805073 [Priapulus caudatus]|uniref:Uncharacterized protein LOC106805073 n=1 Tax=Priapulus caudatus TaxID=37621 RepID=A0ABM1DQ16_PRICU|nr:PREDICTED: uncharacterized protein LOC106805073 [Priapulus caudatus]